MFTCFREVQCFTLWLTEKNLANNQYPTFKISQIHLQTLLTLINSAARLNENFETSKLFLPDSDV